jgi:poly-D-alanine transfer protein DltD
MDNSVMDNASDMSQAQVEPVVQQSAERMLSQSQVNEIVGSAKREAAERAVETYKRQQVQSQQAQAPQQAHEPNSGRYTSEDDVKRVAGDEIKRHFTQLEQEAQERANVDAANRIVGMFRDKIVAGKGKFEDFDSVTSNVAMQRYPNVVQLLAEHVDNTADVLYHLAKNRDKLYRIEALSEHSPSDAIYEMKRLADSIKSNEESVNAKHPNAPLSQQRPSNTGTESGSLSMSDLKRKYRA